MPYKGHWHENVLSLEALKKTMKNFLMISSRDPFEYAEALSFYEDCKSLADAGADVTLFLVQNGVFPARPSKYTQKLKDLMEKGVKVTADRYALDMRGLSDLAAGVEARDISMVIDHMASGSKVVWH